MDAQVFGHGAGGILGRARSRDLSPLIDKHRRHEFDQRFVGRLRPRRNRSALVAAQSVLDRGLARTVTPCHTERVSDAPQHRKAALIGRGHDWPLLFCS